MMYGFYMCFLLLFQLFAKFIFEFFHFRLAGQTWHLLFLLLLLLLLLLFLIPIDIV
jgi:hypothetical protein